MRARTTISLVLLGLAGACLFAYCGEPPKLVVKRVQVEDKPGVNPVEPMRRSEQRVLLEERDAVTQVLGAPLEIPLAAEGRAKVRTAAALVVPADWKGDRAAEIEFDLHWEGAGFDSQHSVKATVEDAQKRWSTIVLDALYPLTKRSTLTLTARGPQGLAPGLRVAWAVPEVEGYFAAPLSRKLTAAERARPNVLFVSVDTLRADHVSCYGYPRATTPHVDALAAQGVLFEQAIAQAPWTLPSYGSVFTGLLPGRHAAGLIRERQFKYGTDDPCSLEGPNGKSNPLRAGVPTLAQLFGDAGWRTIEFSNNSFLNPAYGLDRGFQRLVSYQYNALAGVELARQWIAEQDRPWFCFLHVMDPHMPYAPPAPWDTRFRAQGIADMPGWPPGFQEVRKLTQTEGWHDGEFIQAMTDFYDGDIAFADDQIGRLLAELETKGVLKNTIVVFHSDHGEELWDHGGFEHGHALHAELLHVPLILRFDGKLPRGVRVASRVRAFDLFPTLLELAGLAVPVGIDAESLMPAIRATAPLAPRDVTAEFLLYGEFEKKARYVGVEKLITSKLSANQVFDVAADPFEMRDLAAERAAFVARERAALSQHHARTLKELPPLIEVQLSAGQRQVQIENGYAGADVDEAQPRRDKKP
ncbi:MAG: sulfatase [Planctomycetes bacterium]|nr:sulfatase [Planctomycetota bacterium]